MDDIDETVEWKQFLSERQQGSAMDETMSASDSPASSDSPALGQYRRYSEGTRKERLLQICELFNLNILLGAVSTVRPSGPQYNGHRCIYNVPLIVDRILFPKSYVCL